MKTTKKFKIGEEVLFSRADLTGKVHKTDAVIIRINKQTITVFDGEKNYLAKPWNISIKP